MKRRVTFKREVLLKSYLFLVVCLFVVQQQNLFRNLKGSKKAKPSKTAISLKEVQLLKQELKDSEGSSQEQSNFLKKFFGQIGGFFKTVGEGLWKGVVGTLGLIKVIVTYPITKTIALFKGEASRTPTESSSSSGGKQN